MALFAFHTNKEQYLDTLHKQKKKEMHIRMHNNDFDVHLRSVHYSTKLQNTKIHKNIKKNKVLSVQGKLGFRILI